MTEELSGPLKMMQDSARRIARVSTEAKLDLDEENYVESFKPHLMDVVHAWSSVRHYSIARLMHVVCASKYREAV